MTSNGHGYQQEQYGRHSHNDGNTSDDSLLLMADDDEDKDRAPLLNNTNHISTMREEILSDQSYSLSTHCHVPDAKFDFGSRNRLILVLLICVLFMGVEIVGMYLN